jgi:hypothetical protein
MSKDIKYKTQIEILEKIRELYSDVLRITSRMDFSRDEHEQIAAQREELLKEITILRKQKDALALGADAKQIDKCEQKIKNLVMSILAETSLLLDESESVYQSLKEDLYKISTANKAAKSYAAHV